MSRSRRRRGPLRPVPLAAAAVAAVGAAAALVVAQNGPGVTIHAADSAALTSHGENGENGGSPGFPGLQTWEAGATRPLPVARDRTRGRR